MNSDETAYIAEFLEEKYHQYNTKAFIDSDPIQIPHQYNRTQDIEIAAFLTAAISWGRRSQIIKKAEEFLAFLDHQPYDFVKEASHDDIKRMRRFLYRTFQGVDAEYFISALQNIYQNHGGLRRVFEDGFRHKKSIFEVLIHFRMLFFSPDAPERTLKHIADVAKGASAKRLNLFLRWMVRADPSGIDFGIWKGIPASSLMIPLDIHTGTVARKLGLLTRKQNDWNAVEELTSRLRAFDSKDPVKYDYALFGLGIFEDF